MRRLIEMSTENERRRSRQFGEINLEGIPHFSRSGGRMSVRLHFVASTAVGSVTILTLLQYQLRNTLTALACVRIITTTLLSSS